MFSPTAAPPPPDEGLGLLKWREHELELTLRDACPGLTVQVLAQCTSTSSQVLQQLRAATARGEQPEPWLLVAQEQTQGRGRQGRVWHSGTGTKGAGDSLTFSLALPLAVADWSGLSLAVGLAIANALDPQITASEPTPAGHPACGPTAPAAPWPRIGLKWPNDLCLLDLPDALTPLRNWRKLGGILIETLQAGSHRWAVVGVGLNVAAYDLAALPASDGPQLPQHHPHLAGETGQRTFSQGYAGVRELQAQATAPSVLHQVAAPLLQALLAFEARGFGATGAERFAARDVLRGLPIVQSPTQAWAGSPQATLAAANTPICPAVACGVDETGALLVHTASGVQRISSAEVSVRPVSRAAPNVPTMPGPAVAEPV